MAHYFEPPTLKGLINWFDVKLNYSAKGDGVADDTTAINNAIAAIPAAGGVVFFPPGTYKITTLTPLTNPVRFIGSGRGVTFLKSTASVGVQVGLGTATTWVDISIEDMTIAPSGATPTKALYIAGGSNSSNYMDRTKIIRVQVDMSAVTNAAADAIYVDGFMIHLALESCRVIGGRDCLSIQSAAIINIQGVTIFDSVFTQATRYCCDITSMIQLCVTDSWFEAQFLTSSYAFRGRGLSQFDISGSMIRYNQNLVPMWLGVGNGTNSSGVIKGCYFDTGANNDKHISANGTANVAVIGCTFVNYLAGLSIVSDSGTNTGWSIHSCQNAFWTPSMVTSPGRVFTGNAVNNTIAAATTTHLGFGFSGVPIVDVNIMAQRMPEAGWLQNLQIDTAGAQPAGGALVFTVMKNGVATGIAATLGAGVAGGLLSDYANRVQVVQGDRISLRGVNNDGVNPSANIRNYSLDLITPGV